MTVFVLVQGLPEIKLSLEILQSQVDALQSLANTQNISLSEDVYLSEITRLNEELSVEKEKRQEIERKLQSLTDKLFQFAVIKKMADVDFTTMLCEPELVMITARTVLFAYINLGINNIYLTNFMVLMLCLFGYLFKI